MAGYAAHARIERADPRFVGTGPGLHGSPRTRADVAWATLSSVDADRVELVGTPLDERLAQWFADVRETWSQTTFYLFDPESWR